MIKENRPFHPRFLKGSLAGNQIERLEYRYDLFFRPVEKEFRGAKVLDLGCHNGRWIDACLKAGASFVDGVDIVNEFLDLARQNLGEANYALYHCDVLDYLRLGGEYDIVLCLGLIYHVMDQLELLRQCFRSRPKLLIMDSTVITDDVEQQMLIAAGQHWPASEAVSITLPRRWLSGWETIPSRRQLEIWLKAAGFDAEAISPLFSKHESVEDYLTGKRVAYYCKPNATFV